MDVIIPHYFLPIILHIALFRPIFDPPTLMASFQFVSHLYNDHVFFTIVTSEYLDITRYFSILSSLL